MKINVREINYKEIEVPDSYTREDIEEMIRRTDYVIGDTTDTEYSYEKFDERTEEYDGKWRELF